MSDEGMFSLEAEQAVIGGLMIENDAIDRIAFLHAEHFGTDANRFLYVTIRKMLAEGKPVDILTVAEELGGKIEQVGGIMQIGEIVRNTPSAANIKRYAEIVVDKAKKRLLMSAIARVSELAHAGGDISDKINQAQDEIMRLSDTASSRDPKRLREILSAAVETIDKRFLQEIEGVLTGMRDVDAKLNGLKDGELIIVAGRPSMGKSAFAVQIASHAAQSGKPALVLSQEMTFQQLADRMFASSGKISMTGIVTGALNDEDWTRLTAAVGKLAELPLYLDDQSALTLADVCAKARMIKRKHGLSLLVVDYLQLMAGEGNNRNAQIEEISRGLKSLAKELKIPVIALSQLSRDCDKRANRRPQLSDLRDSGAIEQDADVIMFIYRDEVHDPDSPDKGTAEIIVGKNRQGETGVVRMAFQGEYSTFADLTGWYPVPQIRARKVNADL